MLRKLKEQYRECKISKSEYIQKMHEVHEVLFEYASILKGTEVTKIEIVADQVVFLIKPKCLNFVGEGLRFVVDSKDQRVAPIEILNFDFYEKDDFSMMNNLMRSSQTVLDIGANVGFHSVTLAKAFPQTQFYAFEPIPKTYSFLVKHIELNSLHNIHPYNFGFSNRAEEITFFYYDEGSVNASAVNLSGRENIQEIKCKVCLVDEFVAENKLKVDFMKCDVEGAELFVFQGAVNTIKKDRPIVFSEILRKWSKKFDYDPNDIFDFFEKLDYSAFIAKANSLHRFKKMNDETIETNFFFIPNEASNLVNKFNV